jgi:hypothetical protein
MPDDLIVSVNGAAMRTAAEALDSKWARQVGNRAHEIAAMLEWGVYVHPDTAETYWREAIPLYPLTNHKASSS